MNYIQQLKQDNYEQSQVIASMLQGLNDLKIYLLSSKFNCGNAMDGQVNVKDVLNWIETIKSVE